MKKLLIVDDHQMIRDAIRSYFTEALDMQVTAEASHGKEALALMKTHHFDLIITDINMPEMNGTAFMKVINETYPEQNVLVVSMINETTAIKKMISLGAKGYVLKNCPKERIIEASEAIFEGKTYYDQEVYHLIMDDIAGKKPKQRFALEPVLTKRELEILHLIMEEQSNQEMSDRLFISTRTVEAHKRNLLSKTGCKTMAGLAIYAIEQKLI